MKRSIFDRKRSYYHSGEITTGEIITVVIAFFVWTALCIIINLKITDNTLRENEKYYKAIQIDNDEQMFKYAMKADEGNALVHGTVKAIDTATLPEIKGEYMAIKVNVERYTFHSKVVEDKDKDGKVIGSHVETWYEWDYITSHTYNCEKVNFLGVDFPYSKFYLSNYKTLNLSENISDELSNKIYMNMLYDGNSFLEREGDRRYTFYIIPIEQEITAFANLKNNSMYNVNSERKESVKVHYKTIPEIMESIESNKNVPNIFFTITWYIVFAGAAYYFVMQRNRWADM